MDGIAVKTSITLDEWKQAIEETCIGTPDKIPSGWLSVAQFGEMRGQRRSAAGETIRRLREANRVDCKKFLVRTGDKLLSVMHYRLKKK